MPLALSGYSGGRLLGRSTKGKGREEKEEEEDSRERRIRSEIAQEVVAGIKEKASAHEDAKSTAQRAAGQGVKQNWDCSQIETEEEEEEEDWQKEDQMCNGLSMTSWRRFWNEEEWEEVLCRRMSCKRYLIEGKKPRGTEEKKKVKVWSTEKMKNKPRDDREDDTGEKIEWRSMIQEEMDQCWKKLAEKIEK